MHHNNGNNIAQCKFACAYVKIAYRAVAGTVPRNLLIRIWRYRGDGSRADDVCPVCEKWPRLSVGVSLRIVAKIPVPPQI